MPVKYTIKTNLVLPFKILIYDSIFKDILAISDKEIAQEDRESSYKQQYILRNDSIAQNIYD
jgi:hypothetical protein